MPEKGPGGSRALWPRPGAARSRFTSLEAFSALDYAAFSRYARDEMAAAAGQDEEVIRLLASYATTPVVSWRWGLPPPELYRWFFAGFFRSWAYPRSLYLLAVSQERLGRRQEARATAARLVGMWSGADSDLPLLAKAQALCRRLGCVTPGLPRPL